MKRPQMEALLDHHQPPPHPAEFVGSAPGESAARLRRLFYDAIGIPEPDEPARLEPLPLPPYEPPAPAVPLLVLTRLLGSGEIAVTRYAGPHARDDEAGEAHTAVHEDTHEADQLPYADVVFRYGDADDPRFGSPADWTAEILDRHRSCALAAYVTVRGACVVRTRAGALLRLDAGPGADADRAVYASALHAWLAAGKSSEELVAQGLTVRTGEVVHPVTVTAV
ncbi:hypothetical protein OG828_09340 [Streptomyces sp. NBC_00457]|uniref:hypothetical protein n=1 Tax=Streptomyces sp. NBC_00457 TaxID=2975748 RepID=UPI002E1E189C